VLLEREQQLARLADLLAEVQASSQGRLVLLGGEAGVGKTALLQRFCDSKPGRGHALWGACVPLRTPRPLGPLVEVAEATGGELERVVAGAARPYEVAEALLRELRRRGLTVLVLEDLHWADEATIDVLALLAARIASAPALVLVSYRDDELDRAHQLRIVLGELVRRPGRIRLDPLSRAAVGELAASHGVDAHELYLRTGGNPFFVTEVLAAEDERIPETVRDAVLARAGRLSEGARALLDAASVVPGGCDSEVLVEIAGESAEHLDESLASGILAAADGGVTFRHELSRLAVEASVPPERKRVLHRRALIALSARRTDSDVAILAHHADSAGDGEGVRRWAPPAAQRAAASGAHREAAEHYRRTLRYAAGLPARERADLLERRAEECYLTAQHDEAIEAQREALDCYRRLGDELGEGNALRSLSRLLFFVGQTAEGEAIALEAIDLLERVPPGHELAMAYCNVSQRRMVVEERDAAIEWGMRALQLAERLDDAEARVYALTNIGSAEAQDGIDDGRLKLLRALDLARSAGLDDHAGRIFNALVMWSMRERRFAQVASDLEDGLAFCTERGLESWRLYLLACRAWLALVRGHWDAAGDSAALVLRHPRSPSVARSSALTALGLIRARRGDAEAVAPLVEAYELGEPTGELTRIGPSAAALGELRWLTGANDAVEGVTDQALALALERKAPWVAGELAYWRRQAGIREELPTAMLAEPYRLSITGDWAAAVEHWRQIGCPYEAALALGGADEEAPLRQALEELQALGARPAAAILARRLRARGVRGVRRGPRPSTRQNPAGLTERELEVLVLVAEGLRNAQIAERLVVAQKTVDHHVSAILRKLDAPTRGQAAAAAARLGLLDPQPR
jgi:DNA-binding CsgD family transcriptional regulator/tetratricopeptide (TPR) repeat protein